MTAIASPEFIALCRAQLQLLTQRLTPSSAALYIADTTASNDEQSNFVPIVSYPEPVESWVANFERASSAHFDASKDASTEESSAAVAEPPSGSTSAQTLLHRTPTLHKNSPSAAPSQRDFNQLALPSSIAAEDAVTESVVAEGAFAEGALVPAMTAPEAVFTWPDVLQPEQRLVTPLVYTDVVVGLLVAVRSNGVWNSAEREHIEKVGASLAGGCVLERRNQWLQGQLAQKRGLQSRQSEVFHNLLHQFRNPLTAVSTFGQLMVKKLGPDDPNAPIATGIVRENKRLRELVSHFDEAVAIGDADIAADIATDRGMQRPQLGPSRSLLPASEVSETLISEALMASEIKTTDVEEANSSAVGSSDNSDDLEERHGLGQPLTLRPQHLPDIVEPVLAVSGIVAAEKGILLRAQVAADTPPVWGEEEALGEVVTNLVDNAMKYSPDGATVWVQTGVSREERELEPTDYNSHGSADADYHRARYHDDRYQSSSRYQSDGYQGIIVGDTGPGIPADDLPHLFERNYRGMQALGDIPGTGLGLAIAQSLIQEMQGFIEVISPAVGTPWLPVPRTHPDGLGTVFVVWLKEVNRVSEVAIQ